MAAANTDFTEGMDNLAEGSWSHFENILFVNLVNYFDSNILDCSHSSLRTVNLPQEALLRHKSKKQCAGKLMEYTKEKELFQQIVKPPGPLNCFENS